MDWSTVRFPDLDGTERTLDDPAWANSPRLVQIMGTWCPNCNDQTDLLVELQRRHGPAGLQIVSLAFEHGDAKRNTAVVRRYQEHHGAPWTSLLAGPSKKREASAALPFLDELRAYPTLLFVDREGAIQAVYTGFTGPAAPQEHLALRAQYDALIAALLD